MPPAQLIQCTKVRPGQACTKAGPSCQKVRICTQQLFTCANESRLSETASLQHPRFAYRKYASSFDSSSSSGSGSGSGSGGGGGSGSGSGSGSGNGSG